MQRSAFTLVELLVVISIIGILSTLAVVATSSAGMNARNQKRKADMVQLSKALELYYSDYGAYPSTGGSGDWRGACTYFNGFPDIDPADYPSHTSWIPGLTKGGYVSALPHDPDTNRPREARCASITTQACYVYVSNGTDYKLLAYCTPEGTIGSDSMADPVRGTYSYAVFTPGARNW